MPDTFFVRNANRDGFVEAKFLTDANGNYVVSQSSENSNVRLFSSPANDSYIGSNQEGFIIVPAQFDIKSAIDFGRKIGDLRSAAQQNPDPEAGTISEAAADFEFFRAFLPSVGWLDVQTHYNDTTGTNVPAFRAAASYLLGVAGSEAGYSLDGLFFGGGEVNKFQRYLGNVRDTSGAAGNSPDNATAIQEGFTAGRQRIFGESDAVPGTTQFAQTTGEDGRTTTTITLAGFEEDPVTVVDVRDARSGSESMTIGISAGCPSAALSFASDNSAFLQLFAQGEISVDTRSFDSQANTTGRVVRTNDGVTVGETYADGHVSSVSVTSADGNTQSFAGDIGGALGSNLGALLGGNSLAARALGSTVVGTLGRTLGQSLEQSGLFSQSVTERALDGLTVLDRSAGDAIEQVGLASENGAIDGANFGDSVGGGISSLLVGEAAQALGLHGFGGQLFTTVAGSITTRLVNNLGNLVIPPGEGLGVDSLDVLFAGFESAEFGMNLVGNIGAVFGSFLGGQIVHPETQAGGIGASIGSSIGAIAVSQLIGNAVLPIIGGFIGAFIGDILGTLIGERRRADRPNPPSAAGTLPGPISFGFRGGAGKSRCLRRNIAARRRNACGSPNKRATLRPWRALPAWRRLGCGWPNRPRRLTTFRPKASRRRKRGRSFAGERRSPVRAALRRGAVHRRRGCPPASAAAFRRL